MPDSQGKEIKNILTEDEKAINDYIKTRLNKVLGDIRDLTDEKSEDLIAWSSAFSYLSKTYGKSSDEPFKWFKYYLREGKIPASVQLPLLMQIYSDGAVDKGFVNILARVFKNEPAEDKQRRMNDIRSELKKYLDTDGMLCLYRGSFKRPFGTKDDESRPIERAFAFTLEESVALHYATCWYPETATIYTVQVPVEEVARYSLYEEDKPVIIIPQSKGGSFKVISERDIPKSEYHPDEDEKIAKYAYRSNFESR